ncbi:MAG: hypothetical protein H6710_22505 [Myxococcales bacterium]|nr:hypothetical protein [Myxococcales bacterium]
MPTLTEALVPLLPTDATAEAEHAAAFARIAALLLGEVTLRIAGVAHRIAEIEFYWTSAVHPDPFTHLDPIQRERGRWYFHRQGGTYKGGTYKGLDVAVGAPAIHGGILLRAIEAIEDGARIEGSCAVVDRILAGASSPLFLELRRPGEAREVVTSPRVGLTLKRGADPLRRRYLGRPYRFLIDPANVRKGRQNLVIGLHQAGRAPAAIAALTGVSPRHVERYVAAFEAGRADDPATYQRSLSGDELCRLLGALAAEGAAA